MKFSVVSHFPNEFLESNQGLHVSIYQSTDILQKGGGAARIEFKNTLRTLFEDARLAQNEQMKNQLLLIEQDTLLWSYTRAGIAVFCNQEECQIYHLSLPVEKESYVGDSFLVAPLLYYFKTDTPFQVMVIGKDDFVLYNGSRQGLTEINLDEESTSFREIYSDFDPSSVKFRNKHGGSRLTFISRSGETFREDREVAKYFHKVDRFINQILDKRQQLFVVGQPKQTQMFRSLSQFPRIVDLKETIVWNIQSEKALLDQILELLNKKAQTKNAERKTWIHQMLEAGKYTDNQDYMLDVNNRPLFNMLVVNKNKDEASLKQMNQEVINTIIRQAMATNLSITFLDTTEFFVTTPVFMILHIPLNRKE